MDKGGKMASGELPATLRRAVEVTLQNYGVAAIISFMFLLVLPWRIQWYLIYTGGFFCVSSFLLPFVDDWRPKAKVSAAGKAVFISGCDSGFGHSLAQRLDDLGMHVFAGCLFPEKSGAESLRKSCSERLRVLPLDVTSEDSVNSAVKYVAENIGNIKFWALVNNAGIGGSGEVAWALVDRIKFISEVNTFGVVRLTKAFLPLLCEHKGRIVTVASSSGRCSLPGSVPYCMSKRAAIGFCEGLRLEMYRFGLKVVTIEPLFYRTPITDWNTRLRHMEEAWEKSSPEIKAMYPEDYLKTYFHISKYFKWFISQKILEVISCLEEAILAVDPKYVYRPGTLLSRISHWCSCRYPKPIADAFIHYGCVPPLHNLIGCLYNMKKFANEHSRRFGIDVLGVERAA